MKDTASRIEAARRAAGLFDFSAGGRLALTGRDRIDFLHAMVTSDVAGLAEGAAQPSLLVTAKGKIVADLVIIRRTDDVLIETAPERRAATAEALRKYIISEDVQVEDRSATWSVLSLHGPVAGHVLSHACVGFDPVPALEFLWTEVDAPEGRVLILRHDRLGLMGFDVWVAAERADLLRDRILECGEAHGVRACGDGAREALRVAAGRAAWGREMEGDEFPDEVGLGGAVSYTKGCFVGQEVLARIHNLGHVNRALARVDTAAEAAQRAALPIALVRDGREAGRLTSVARLPGEARAVGLALVRAEGAAPGAAYEARPAGGAAPFAVTIRDLVR
jgi:aminomethyltransferase